MHMHIALILVPISLLRNNLGAHRCGGTSTWKRINVGAHQRGGGARQCGGASMWERINMGARQCGGASILGRPGSTKTYSKSSKVCGILVVGYTRAFRSRG